MLQPITRFAPSPTGALHIGGTRTALFNWLFARANGGKFLLRIEDTDRERSLRKHKQNIIDGLRWLGLDWDDKPFIQSAGKVRHVKVAFQMLEKNQAYKCFATPEEINKHREHHPKEPFISPWRDIPENKHPAAPFAIRLKRPRRGEIIIEDAVQKPITWNTSEFNDMVLLRSDRTPTYMLAVVVDDHDMGITHIIRGNDHFKNAAQQKLIYDAMGWECPTFAHIPLIHGMDGGKLSKRHGAPSVLEYAKEGYMPEAMRNALTRLGWSHGDEEFFTSKDAIKWFKISGIKKSPAQFDEQKLKHINNYHIKNSSKDALCDALIAYRRIKYRKITEFEYSLKETLRDVLSVLSEQDRGRTLSKTWDNVQFSLMRRPIKIKPRLRPYLRDEMRPTLDELTSILTSANFTREDLMQDVKAFAEKKQIKMNTIAELLRITLSGKKTGPSVFDMLCFLGREESLARINDCLNE